jgi:hypothetical protein
MDDSNESRSGRSGNKNGRMTIAIFRSDLSQFGKVPPYRPHEGHTVPKRPNKVDVLLKQVNPIRNHPRCLSEEVIVALLRTVPEGMRQRLRGDAQKLDDNDHSIRVNVIVAPIGQQLRGVASRTAIPGMAALEIAICAGGVTEEMSDVSAAIK